MAIAGAGPAGSVAALVLARGGARVVLVDKASFPRDKACGDLVGPRAVGLLADLGLAPPPHVEVGDLLVVGPTGGTTRLPARAGLAYPGTGWALPRHTFDAWLWEAAVQEGAEARRARVATVDPAAPGDQGLGSGPLRMDLDTGEALVADVVIAADGATSGVAQALGLVDPDRTLWGFAVRTYLAQEVTTPVVAFWDPEPARAFPGYGWLFPGPEGTANAGLGVSTGGDRRRGALATRALEAFLDHLRALRLLDGGAPVSGPGDPSPARLGGWVKMGMVGTIPARGRALVVGDAAGLVNPLQGEGITQALDSGAAAARAVLAGPATAAGTYRAHLRARHASFQSATAALHAAVIHRPRATSYLGRVLTTPPVGSLVGPGWALYWNNLLAGAAPGPGRRVAALADAVARGATAPGRTRRWLDRALAD